VPKWHVIEPLQ